MQFKFTAQRVNIDSNLFIFPLEKLDNHCIYKRENTIKIIQNQKGTLNKTETYVHQLKEHILTIFFFPGCVIDLKQKSQY